MALFSSSTSWTQVVEDFLWSCWDFMADPFRKGGFKVGLETVGSGIWNFIFAKPLTTALFVILGTVAFFKLKGRNTSDDVIVSRESLRNVRNDASVARQQASEANAALTAVQRTLATQFDLVKTAVADGFRNAATTAGATKDGVEELVTRQRSLSAPAPVKH